MQHDGLRVIENNVLRKILCPRRRMKHKTTESYIIFISFVLLTRHHLGNQTGNDVMDWAHSTWHTL